VQVYHFRESATIAAPADTVWRAVVEPGLPRWADGLLLMYVRGGEVLQLGSVVDAAVRSRLPFTLSFTFEVTRLEQTNLIEVRSWGDIAGTGSWTMEAIDAGTIVTYRWDVWLTNRILDALGSFGPMKRTLARNHDRVMHRAFGAMAVELEDDPTG